MPDSDFAAPTIDSLAGSFPGYEIDHLIASGGMGAVYRARRRGDGRSVAIKILPRELGDDPLFRKSFRDEATVMARLDHPNLIAVIDSGETDGLPFIVMEYVHGKSLHHSANGRSVDARQAVDIVLGICAGLAHAHERGIVHRDIKPANVLLTPDRRAKIGDFGLARADGHQPGGLTMGTPDYAAPEVISHPERADRRSDVFATGVILVELLSGRLPDPESDEFPVIEDLELEEICRRATHPDPGSRYSDAGALENALKGWQARHQGAKEADGTIEEPPRRRSRRAAGPSRAALAGSLAVVLLLAATVHLIRRSQPEPVSVEAVPTLSEDPSPVEETPIEPVVIEPEPASVAPVSAMPEVADSPEPAAEEPETPAVEAPTESPAESLLRLRESLVAGDFSELPLGSFSGAAAHLFFVPRPMDWDQARRFAEAFGGHLPLSEPATELAWLGREMPEDAEASAFWLGARRNDGERWQSIDGSLPDAASAPTGEGAFAAATRDGSLRAEDADTRLPFYIRWRKDGTDPSDLAAVLRRTAPTLGTPDETYPFGTEQVGDRRFLIVRKPCNLAEARRLAEIGRGRLMVPATPSEADWLETAITRHTGPDGFRLGGSLIGNRWTWDSGEAWTFARWAENGTGAEGTSLVAVPGAGWRYADPAAPASGLVIEWSDDHRQSPAPNPEGRLRELDNRAAELLQGFDAVRTDALRENAKEYLWHLEVWLRRQRNENAYERWRPGVSRLAKSVRSNLIPPKVPEANKTFCEPMLAITREYLRKQQGIDAAFLAKARPIRDAYLDRLMTRIETETRAGQPELVRELRERVGQAADMDAWMETVAKIPRREIRRNEASE